MTATIIIAAGLDSDGITTMMMTTMMTIIN